MISPHLLYALLTLDFPTILNGGKLPHISFCWSSLNQQLAIHRKKEQLCLHILMNKDLLKHSHYKWKSCWWACRGSALSDWEQLTFCPYHTYWFLPLRKAKDYHACPHTTEMMSLSQNTNIFLKHLLLLTLRPPLNKQSGGKKQKKKKHSTENNVRNLTTVLKVLNIYCWPE